MPHFPATAQEIPEDAASRHLGIESGWTISLPCGANDEQRLELGPRRVLEGEAP